MRQIWLTLILKGMPVCHEDKKIPKKRSMYLEMLLNVKRGERRKMKG